VRSKIGSILRAIWDGRQVQGWRQLLKQ